MVAASAACVPLSQILIRNYLSEQYGVDFAGLWEALTRLSGAYMMFITTTLSVYLLPRYSEIKQSIELKNEVIKSLIIVIPVAIVCSSMVFILKEWLVLFLFTKDFLPMTDLVAWQAVGDTLKISSWILGFLLWAKALTAAFIITEIFFSFSLYVITVLLSPVFGEQGVVIAYAINYFLYFLALSVYFYFWFRKSSINELSIAAAPIK
jgi:PST family polysaccharide transporter